MPIKLHQSSGLTVPTSSVNVKGSSLTHAELDANFEAMWPIGSIYVNMDSEKNPEQLIGLGKWESFGQKTIFVGHNDSPAGTNASTGVQAALTGLGGARDTDLSKHIRTIFATEGKLEISFYTNHKFARGQRVTIAGIETANCTTTIGDSPFLVNPNGEREILHLGKTNFNCPLGAITVDYTDPPRNLVNTYIPGPDGTKTKSTGKGTVTLFGTAINSSPAEPTIGGVIGTGGENEVAIQPQELPKHTHTVNWESTTTGNDQSKPTEGDDNRPGNGKNLVVPFAPIPGTSDADGYLIETGSLAYSEEVVQRQNRFDNAINIHGEPHGNMMPFVTAYFWRRKA